MYHCSLNIVIFSQESHLETSVRSIPPLERFEHKITTFSKLSEEAIVGGDIVIVDFPLKNGTNKLRLLCKEGAILIVCATPSEIAALDETSLIAADLFWEKPLHSKLTTLRFQKLLSHIKLHKDYYLSRTYLDGLTSSLPDMVWFKDCAGSHLKVNKEFCSMVGKNMNDIIGRDHCYIWNVTHDDPDSGEMVCKASEDIVMAKGKTCLFTEQVKSQHGMRQLRTYKTPLYSEKGQIMGTVGVGHDITDLENLGTELEVFLKSMPFGILICNENGVITNANEKFEQYFDLNKNDVIGLSFEAWKANAFMDAGTVNSEGLIEAKSRTCNPTQNKMLEIHGEPIYDVFQNIAGHICIYRDVTLERELEDKILNNSNTDFMTGLYNRRYFYQYVHAMRGDEPISLLSVDLDYFKNVNDTYGHQVGDKALVCTANIIRQCFTSEVIARVGGDEFLIVILGECSINDLKIRAQNLLDSMRETFVSSPQLSILSASIGIAQTHDPTLDIDILIQQSDTALYTAKKNGKAQFCVYTPPLEENKSNQKVL